MNKSAQECIKISLFYYQQQSSKILIDNKDQKIVVIDIGILL